MNRHQLSGSSLGLGCGRHVVKLLTIFPAVMLLIVAAVAYFIVVGKPRDAADL